MATLPANDILSEETTKSESPWERQMQGRLDAVVRGAIAFVDVEFDGPATAYIGTDPRFTYVTLCSFGIKPQGAAAPTYESDQEAIELYGEQLRAMVKENAGKMLAWRCRPALEREGDSFKVYSRLVFM